MGTNHSSGIGFGMSQQIVSSFIVYHFFFSRGFSPFLFPSISNMAFYFISTTKLIFTGKFIFFNSPFLFDWDVRRERF